MTGAGAAAPTGPSTRVRLARIAAGVAAAIPGVALTTLGNSAWQTADRDQRIAGVTAVTDPDARIEVRLHLAMSWPPQPLAGVADELREQIRAAADTLGLAGQLGDVHVEFVAIEDDGDRAPA